MSSTALALCVNLMSVQAHVLIINYNGLFSNTVQKGKAIIIGKIAINCTELGGGRKFPFTLFTPLQLYSTSNKMTTQHNRI